jgi:uncharacterized protein YkwD
MIKMRDSLVRLKSDSLTLRKNLKAQPKRRNLIGPQSITQSQAQKNYQKQLALEKKQLQSQTISQHRNLQKGAKKMLAQPQPIATVQPKIQKKAETEQEKVMDGLESLNNDDAELADMDKTRKEIDQLNKMLGDNDAGINKLESDTGLEDDLPSDSAADLTAVTKPAYSSGLKIKVQNVMTQIKKKNSPKSKIHRHLAATPAATTPAATTPAATTPAASTPAATTPAASTPAATTPAASTPAATTPAASTPAVSVTPPYACPTKKEAVYSRDASIAVIDILNAINNARTNPKAFAETFKKLYLDPVDDQGKHCLWGITLTEKRAGVLELYNWLLNDAVPAPAISGNGCLTVDAYNHARYMSDNNLIVHTEIQGSNTLDLKERLQKWGRFDVVTEAVGSIQKDHLNAYSLVCHILLDDGITSRVNRLDMFDNQWKTGGAGLRPNGMVNYYSVTYAKHYHCTMQDSIADWLKRDSGANQFFGGVRDTSSARILSLTVAIILLFNLLLS